MDTCGRCCHWYVPPMPKLKPRRRPQRQSSKSIVTAILDAASALLVDAGLVGMTTNAIAERAGISVGSLYQYFPNKQAICAGIAGRVNERLLQGLTEAVASEGTPVERLDAAIAILCSVQIGSHAVRSALLEHVPRNWEESLIPQTETDVLSVLGPLFVALAPGIPESERNTRQAIATFAVRGAVQASLLHQPDLLQQDQVHLWLRNIVLAAIGSPFPPTPA